MIVWCICYKNYNILCWFLVVVMHSLVQVTCGDSTVLKARINDMASLSANSAQDYGEICPANNNVKHSNRVEDKSKSGFGNFTKYTKKVKRRTRDHSYAEETSRSDLELPMRLNADETPLRKVAKKASLVRNQQSKKRRKEVFSSKNCTKVLAQVGSTVVMNCEVNDITENTVTWIRRKDYSLLSVGLVTYSADPRFRSAHGKHIKDWALHIRYSNVSDSGYYECQVPTHPPTSIFIKLLVIEAYADILGEPEKIVQQGSLLRLTCLIKGSTEPPTYVFWYYDDRMINYDLNGITVSQSRHSSELLVARASPQHAGNYTCVPANARPASVVVHVVLSEAPAAMQHGNTSSGNQPPATTILQFFSIVLLALTLRNIVL